MKKKFFKGYFSSSVTMQDYRHIVTLGSFLTKIPPGVDIFQDVC